MPDYKYDENGNQYVRVAESDGAGCALIILGLVVWSIVSAVVAWLQQVFIQVAKASQWVYNPPLAKGFYHSVEGLVGGWYWLTIFKPVSLLLHFIVAFFRLLGFVCDSVAGSATGLWAFGSSLTPYPNFNLILSLLLEVGGGVALILAYCLLIHLVATTYEAVDDFWARHPSLHHKVGAVLTTLGQGYLYSLPLPFIFWIVLKMWQWVFATA